LIFWRLGFCFFVRLLGFFILIYFLVFCFLFSYFVRFLSMFTCVYHPCLLFFLWANAFLFIILNLIRKGTYQLIWGFFFIFFFNENLKIMVFFIFFKMYMIDSFQITTIFFLYDNLGIFLLEKQSKSSFIRIS